MTTGRLVVDDATVTGRRLAIVTAAVAITGTATGFGVGFALTDWPTSQSVAPVTPAARAVTPAVTADLSADDVRRAKLAAFAAQRKIDAAKRAQLAAEKAAQARAAAQRAERVRQARLARQRAAQRAQQQSSFDACVRRYADTANGARMCYPEGNPGRYPCSDPRAHCVDVLIPETRRRAG